jgi:hypothetical protein
MRPRRAAHPPAAPARSARSTIGAVAHRSEDPPHDGGIAIAADSVQCGLIIRPPRRHGGPASRSRFGGLAFHDPDDVEGSHVRHNPPPPGPLRAVNHCRQPGTRTHTLRAPGPATGDSTGRIFPPIGAEQARRIQIPDRAPGCCAPRTAGNAGYRDEDAGRGLPGATVRARIPSVARSALSGITGKMAASFQSCPAPDQS